MSMGKIYLQIATKVMSEQYSDMYQSQRTAILARGNEREIEGFLDIKYLIENACFAIRRELEKGDVYLPESFTDTIIYSDTPKGDLGVAIESIKERQFFETGKGEIALAAIAMAHDGWVMKHQSRFFDPANDDQGYLFLRTELIGLDTIKEYLTYVDPILTVLELKPDPQYLRRAYREAQEKLGHLYGLNSLNDLTSFIRRADYQPLSSAMMTSMSDPLVARRLAEQVIEHQGAPW